MRTEVFDEAILGSRRRNEPQPIDGGATGRACFDHDAIPVLQNAIKRHFPVVHDRVFTTQPDVFMQNKREVQHGRSLCDVTMFPGLGVDANVFFGGEPTRFDVAERESDPVAVLRIVFFRTEKKTDLIVVGRIHHRHVGDLCGSDDAVLLFVQDPDLAGHQKGHADMQKRAFKGLFRFALHDFTNDDILCVNMTGLVL